MEWGRSLAGEALGVDSPGKEIELAADQIPTLFGIAIEAAADHDLIDFASGADGDANVFAGAFGVVVAVPGVADFIHGVFEITGAAEEVLFAFVADVGLAEGLAEGADETVGLAFAIVDCGGYGAAILRSRLGDSEGAEDECGEAKASGGLGHLEVPDSRLRRVASFGGFDAGEDSESDDDHGANDDPLCRDSKDDCGVDEAGTE